MADSVIHAVITFTDGKTKDVQSTVQQIMNAIEGITTPHIPLIEVIERGGAEVWINANHIREFRAFDPSERQGRAVR